MALFTRICQVEAAEDAIVFNPETLKVAPVREADRYQGARLSLRADLARAEIPVLVDIGFGDHVYPNPKRENFPDILDGLPTAKLLMYPPETVVAEKFEAMIRFGEANGRIKDFHDIWVMTRTFRFDLARVIKAVSGTLRCRETAFPVATPLGLTDAFAAIAEERRLWSGFLRRTRRPWSRRRSPTFKRSCAASSVLSSPASGHQRAPGGSGIRPPARGAKAPPTGRRDPAHIPKAMSSGRSSSRSSTRMRAASLNAWPVMTPQ